MRRHQFDRSTRISRVWTGTLQPTSLRGSRTALQLQHRTLQIQIDKTLLSKGPVGGRWLAATGPMS